MLLNPVEDVTAPAKEPAPFPLMIAFPPLATKAKLVPVTVETKLLFAVAVTVENVGEHDVQIF